jgi:tetratricopeptide (TPR) repeat protein
MATPAMTRSDENITNSQPPLSVIGRSPAILAGLLFAATFLLYIDTLNSGFVNYDDPAYVTANPHVLQGLSWSNIKWALTATTEANWHPLTWMSHMLDVELFGVNPRWHHLDSIFLHALNVLLLFLLLRKATGSLLRSAFVAALFAAHPLNVESVAWISERKTLLSMLFLLLTFLAYQSYAGKRSWLRYALVFVCFGLGLAAKPMVITLPVLFLLWDYWPLRRLDGAETSRERRSFIWLVFEKTPLFLLSAASAWITLYAQRKGGALGSMGVLPINERIGNAIFSYVAYLGKGIWPSRLAVFYPHPEGSLAFWKVLSAGLVLVIVTVLAWSFRRQHPWLLTGWIWYLVAMFPMIGIVQVGRQAMADRYAYLPFVGLFVITAWGGSELLMDVRSAISTPVVVAGAVLVTYASVAFLQTTYWRNSYTLFSHALAVTSRNGVAEGNLGVALVQMGRPDLALPHFEAAEQFAPQLSTPHYNLGVLRQEQGHPEAAAHEYELALKYSMDPTEIVQAHNNLGFLLLNQNEFAAAGKEFTAALQISPDKQNSLIGRGMAEFHAGKMDAAITDLTRAARISPSAAAQFWLGRTYESIRNDEAAIQAYEAALQIAPDMTEARQRLQHIREAHARSSNAEPKPTELVVKGYERRVLRGELLSPEGWKQASELFTTPQPYPPNSEITVEWTGTSALGEEWNNDSRAQVNTKWNDYYGVIDSSLVFKRSPYAALPMAESYSLVFMPSLSDKTTSGHAQTGVWKIEGHPGRAADIPHAITYLERMRSLLKNPILRKNAETSILALKQVRTSCGVPNPC